MIKEYVPEAKIEGEIYGRFYGLFTSCVMSEGMNILLSQEIFADKKAEELLARHIDQLKRFDLGLFNLDYPFLYTDIGKQWYIYIEEIKNKYDNIDLINEFDFSNQPYIFSFKKFKQVN